MSFENHPTKDKHEAPKEPAKESTLMEHIYEEVHHLRDELRKEKRDFFGIPEILQDKNGKEFKNPLAWNPFLM